MSFLRSLPALALLAFALTPARADTPVLELRDFAGQVRCVTFSPDGRTLAAAGTFNVVRLLDASTGRELRKLEGHTNWALWTAWSPDGKGLASAGFDGTVRLWDATGKLRHTLTGHSVPQTTGVTFSPDGRLVASVNYDSTVRLWDAGTGRLLHTLVGHRADAHSVAFSPDGRLLASGGVDGTVRLWEAGTGKAIRACLGHTGYVTTVAFAPDGRTLYSGGHDGTVRVWESATGRSLRMWAGGGGWTRHLAVSPDGHTLGVANENGTARLWEVATGQVRRHYRADNGWAWSAGWSPDGRTLATSGNQFVRLWDVSGRRGAAAVGPADLDGLWTDLLGADAPRAYTAGWALSSAPKLAVPFLERRLQPAKAAVGDRRLARLIAELDDDDFEVRERATQELTRLGRSAARALRAALAGGRLSLEQRRRIEELLRDVGGPEAAGEVRAARVVEVLARVGRPDGERLLRELTRGPAGDPLTIAAGAALKRLAGR